MCQEVGRGISVVIIHTKHVALGYLRWGVVVVAIEVVVM